MTITTEAKPILIDHPTELRAADTSRLRDLARELVRQGRPEEAELVLRATALAPDVEAEAEHRLVLKYLAAEHDLRDFDRYMRGVSLWFDDEEGPEERYLAFADDDLATLLTAARHLADRGSYPWAETVARVAAQRCPDAAAGRPSRAFDLWFAIDDQLHVTGLLTDEEYHRTLKSIYHIDTGMEYEHYCHICPGHRADAGDERVPHEEVEALWAGARKAPGEPA